MIARAANSKRDAVRRARFARLHVTDTKPHATLPGPWLTRRERKKIEMRFAHLKRILRLGRLRLRGPQGAQDEFVLAAIAQNLRRLASLVALPAPTQVLCSRVGVASKA
jgi:Transposase DDE domain